MVTDPPNAKQSTKGDYQVKILKIGAIDSFDLEISDIAPDKSISHRCAIFSLLSDKKSEITNFLEAEDTLNSLGIVKKLGAEVKKKNNTYFITPPKKIKEPSDILDCGNSGTAMRLFTGLLAGVDGFFVLSGDKYLRGRPMRRVIEPLSKIGAKIDARDNANLAPIAIRGKRLQSFDYESKISSAQVKSAMILSALFAKETSTYLEPSLSRDHSERMLRGMGAEIEELRTSNNKLKIKINPLSKPLKPLNMTVPSDPSSAFFFAVLAAITPNSRVVLKNILLNPTRIEAFRILEQMGAKIEFIQKENIYEPIGDIIVSYSTLKAIEVSKNIAWLIDELPALSIAFAFASGKSIVKNAKELRVKESDRISTVIQNLQLANIKTNEFEDGYEIAGGVPMGAEFNSFGDHRIAMSFALLCAVSGGGVVKDTECIDTSFPNFVSILSKITEVEEI